MCPITIGTALGASAASAAVVGSLAITSAVTIGMGVYSANVQSSIAQANLNAQAQQARINHQLQMDQARMNQDHHLQTMIQNRQQEHRAHNLQLLQANTQIEEQWRQQRQNTINERQAIIQKNESDRVSYQRSVEQARDQIGLNNEAANRVYTAEQAKLNEAKKQAAFEQQHLLAKSIGDAGSILATGRTGQSVGLLLKDVERQKGFGQAQADAMTRSKRDAAVIAMEGGLIDAQSANLQAISNIGFNPQEPWLPPLPGSPQFIDPIGLAIDT